MKGCLPDSHAANLDPDALSLLAHGLAEIGHLGANNVVDCFTRAVDVLADRLGDVVNRNRFNELLAPVARGAIAAGRLLPGPACAVAAPIGNPSRSRRRAIARPPCTFEPGKGSPLCAASGSAQYRRNRTAAAWPGAKDQRDDRAYCGAKKCRSQQVELLLTLFVRIRLADGCAGAGSPTRRRLQCIGHQGPPPFRMPR